MRYGAALLAAIVLILGGVTPAHAQTEVVEYYALDAIGSVRVVFDVNGNVIGRMDYDPFGAPLSSGNGLPSRAYAGLFRDGEAGLDFAQARSYQVRTGRFSTVDPIYAGLFEPQAWNRYAYALNAPLDVVDQTGLDACSNQGSTATWNEDSGTFQFPSTTCHGASSGDYSALNGLAAGRGSLFGVSEFEVDTLSFDIPTIVMSGALPDVTVGVSLIGVLPPPPVAPGPTGPGRIGPGPNGPLPAKEPPKRTLDRLLRCSSDQLGVTDLFAVGAVALGQPVAESKRFVTPGSSKGTSYAGKAADWVFGGARLPLRLPTIVGGPGTGRALAVAGTKSVARFAGRAVPIIGWGILAYDAVKITACTVR
jgi:RHS repeat-associated protein